MLMALENHRNLRIMLALCLMLLPSYYAQNYAGINGSSLQLLHKKQQNLDMVSTYVCSYTYIIYMYVHMYITTYVMYVIHFA